MARGNLGNIPEAATISSTAAGTAVTTTLSGTPAYAFNTVGTTGLNSAGEVEGLIRIVINLQARVAELETQLQALGMLDN